jgi:hypothetical protein
MAISNLPITNEDRASDQIIADCSLPCPRTFCNQQLARFAHVHVSDERAQKDWTKMTKYAVTRLVGCEIADPIPMSEIGLALRKDTDGAVVKNSRSLAPETLGVL